MSTVLKQVIEKNAELTIENSDLQKKVVELHHVSDECQQLKNTLNKVESDCVSAQSEVRNLSGKVRNLECVLEEMHKAAENRREIERQHKEALESLKRKQGEVELVATKKQAEIIDQLKTTIAGLETERRVQNERHQELILEMAELKRYGGSGIGGAAAARTATTSPSSSPSTIIINISNLIIAVVIVNIVVNIDGGSLHR